MSNFLSRIMDDSPLLVPLFTGVKTAHKPLSHLLQALVRTWSLPLLLPYSRSSQSLVLLSLILSCLGQHLGCSLTHLYPMENHYLAVLKTVRLNKQQPYGVSRHKEILYIFSSSSPNQVYGWIPGRICWNLYTNTGRYIPKVLIHKENCNS